jgi:hypothetical protein
MWSVMSVPINVAQSVVHHIEPPSEDVLEKVACLCPARSSSAGKRPSCWQRFAPSNVDGAVGESARRGCLTSPPDLSAALTGVQPRCSGADARERRSHSDRDCRRSGSGGARCLMPACSCRAQEIGPMNFGRLNAVYLSVACRRESALCGLTPSCRWTPQHKRPDPRALASPARPSATDAPQQRCGRAGGRTPHHRGGSRPLLRTADPPAVSDLGVNSSASFHAPYFAKSANYSGQDNGRGVIGGTGGYLDTPLELGRASLAIALPSLLRMKPFGARRKIVR